MPDVFSSREAQVLARGSREESTANTYIVGMDQSARRS